MSDNRRSRVAIDSLPAKPRRECRQVSIDELHQLFADPRRRMLLSYLTTRPHAVVSIDDLVDVVIEQEQNGPEPAVDRNSIATALHHLHLPKLADAGVLRYDSRANTVRYDTSDDLEALLETSNRIEGRTE